METGTPMVPWPNNWPRYKQACFSSFQNSCDMLVGPCACGAWHQQGEFELKGNEIHRYGSQVDPRDQTGAH